MSTNKRKHIPSDESASSSSTKYSMRSFSTVPTSPPHGPDPEDSGWPAENRTHPIVAKDLIVHPWTQGGLREAVLAEIDSLSNWVSVDVFRRGVSTRPKDCPPTIIITIVPGTMDHGCIDVVERIKGHIEKHNLDAAVEVVEGTVERYQVLEDVGKGVGLGASIALAGISAIGTLGGYVRLESDEMGQRVYGLTCHHVVVSKNDSSKDAIENGVQPKCWKASDKQVESPSKEDIDDSIQARNDYLQFRQGRLNQTREAIEGHAANDARKGRLPHDIEAVKIAAARVNELVELDRRLGCVLATSGFRVASSGCAVDWGLVEVDKERVAGNMVKSIPNIFDSDTGRVTETCEFDDEAKVYKFGRATLSTEGRFSHIQSEVKLPDSPHKTTEKVFIATGSHGKCFGTNGDSGAWVLDKDGKLGGLLIAGNPQMGLVYVTPIGVVFADIEARLSCKVKIADDE